MVKTKTRSKTKPIQSSRQSKPNRRRRRPGLKSGMDAAALAYARLLADPCGAPLVHPVYAGAGSGYLSRFQTTFEINNVTNDTQPGLGTLPTKYWSNLALMFAPGQISSSVNGFLSNTSGMGSVLVTSGTSVVETVNGTTVRSYVRKLSNDRDDQPGYSFLSGLANSKNVSCRPVAACMKVRYLGAELDRSGICGASFLPNAEVFINEDLGTSGTISDSFATRIVNTAQKTTRTPDGDIEVKWCPNRGDVRFRDISLNGPTNNVGQPDHSGLAFAVIGLPTNQPVSFAVTLTAVYEWTPDMDTGLTIPFQTTRSSSTLDAVLSYLQSAGNWMVSSHPAANMLRNAAYASMRNAMFSPGFAGAGNPSASIGWY